MKHTSTEDWLIRLGLLGWMGILLFATNGEQSLMAYDEGWYALQSRWMVESGDWITPQWWGEPVYDRTVGLQWMISWAYSLFGVNDSVARLISLGASLLSVQLTYSIGKRLFPPLIQAITSNSITIQSILPEEKMAGSHRIIAATGSAALGVCPLWLNYSRMATQDVPLVGIELLLIWALLKAEEGKGSRFWWGVGVGTLVGIGFFLKSVMVILPLVALLPYLLKPFGWRQLARTVPYHLGNRGIYVGLLLGFIPCSIWLGLSLGRYGLLPVTELFGKLLFLGSKSYHSDGGIGYYFWNIPVNAFPWSLFALAGLGLLLRWLFSQQRLHPLIPPMLPNEKEEVLLARYLLVRTYLLLVAYPVLLFTELTLFSTRTAYYGLQLYPWVGMLAGLTLWWLGRTIQRRIVWGISGFFASCGGFVVGLMIFSGTGAIPLPDEIKPYLTVITLASMGWLSLPLFAQRHRMGWWVVVTLVSSWSALAGAGFGGLWGNYSPDIKSFLSQPIIQVHLKHHPVNLIRPRQMDANIHQSLILISFYTPQLGRQFTHLADLPRLEFAWVQEPLLQVSDYRYLGQIRGWQLVQRM